MMLARAIMEPVRFDRPPGPVRAGLTRPRLAPDAEAPAEVAAILALQRSAGNAAVARAVRGRADRFLVQRTTVNTNGGVFDNGPMYNAVSGTGAVGERVGANIMVDFTPGDLVESPVDGV